MAFNGSGSFSLAAGNPVVTGTTVSSTWANNTLSDIATGLSTTVLKDGQQTITANLPMAGFRHTGVGNATTRAAVTYASATDVQDSTLVYLTAPAGTNTITATAAISMTAYATGQRFHFTPANTNTGATTLNLNNIGAKNVFWNGVACVGGEIRQNIPVTVVYDGTQFHICGNGFPTPTRGALAGLGLSTAGGSTTMTVAAGQATESTNIIVLNLSAAVGKTTGAWAVGTGNGGLDTGAIANSTGYHFYLIMRPDTGVVDVLFSLSATAPTMPANYSFKRRIGWGKTDGSGNWTAFTQDGDYFRWAATVADISAVNPGTAAVSRTLTVPSGVNVYSLVRAAATSTTPLNFAGLLSDLAGNDEVVNGAIGSTFGATFGRADAANQPIWWEGQIRTNTSAQIRSRLESSDANTTLMISTYGWIDRRGRDA